MRAGRRPGCVAALVALAAGLVLSATAGAHIERPSYFPLPGADCSISPCAGGVVPTARSLFTALDPNRVGVTRVVCQGAVPSPARMQTLARSLRAARRHHRGRRRIARLRGALSGAQRAYNAAVQDNASVVALRASIADARAHGYVVRPSQPRLQLTAQDAARLMSLNKQLLSHCGYN